MKPRSQIGALLQEINNLDSTKQYAASTLPRVLFTENIAEFMGLSVRTILFYTGNKKTHGDKLPRWFKLNRRLIWLESDVLEFIRQAQEASADTGRPRGRPTKVEQVRRASK